jgi:ribosomal protein S18 acetylase RimI-like enzyme
VASDFNIKFIIRSYRNIDQPAVRAIFGEDEFARPQLAIQYPRMSEYLADEVSHYYINFEPESLFVAEVDDRVVGALLGAVDTFRFGQYYHHRVQPYLVKRLLAGAYGWPGWLLPIIRTNLAGRYVIAPKVDRRQYPAHLHIGVLACWRRIGIGTALMAHYTDYLCQREVAGFHLYASSFHPLSIGFYRKLRLETLGEFTWRFHNGYEWSTITELIFGKRLRQGLEIEHCSQ